MLQTFLGPAQFEAQRAHRGRQAVEREMRGPLWEANDLVFCSELGGRIDGISLYRSHFLPLLARAGLPRLRFHDLRHTMATLLLLGVHPKVVAEMLGHSTVNITLDTYSHVLPQMQRTATMALDKLFTR